jgi:PAS domain S-box-containing protein
MTETSHIVEVPESGLSGDLPRLLQAGEILEALPAAVYTTNAEGQITFYNRAAAEMWGCRPELGASYFCGSWRLYWPDGKPMRHEDCPMAVALRENRPIRGAEAIAERPDGTMVPFIPYPTPLRDSSGRLIGAVNMLVDISERKRAEKRQKTLVDELNHRVKNMLSTVQSLAMQTFRKTGVPLRARQAFERRLFALSAAHDQLSIGGWESAELSAILHELLAPFGDGERVRFEGEAVSLGPKTALTLAMVLHELATNAVKYGALSTPDGRVQLEWRVDESAGSGQLRIDWKESGGPQVEKPTRRGFGMRLIERAIEKELHGSAEIDFARSGVCGRIEIPVERTGAA